jgi:ABC-2 type transport system permease protein
MSIRIIAVLLGKELKYGSRSYFFIFAVVGPIIITLLVNLIFGTFFSQKPKLGISDQGNSRVVVSLKKMESINLEKYSSEIELKEAVATGARDVGIVLPGNFDSLIKKGKLTTLTAYIWGESLLKNRAVLGAAFLYQARKVSGKKAPVDITAVSLGDKNSIPLKDRFLPIIVLLAIFISGFALPSTSLVEEKQKGTIGAVITTPATQHDIFIAKGLMGTMVSMVMGISILILNHSFNTQSGLIIFILFLGAVMASCFGLILGAFVKDMAALFTTIKGLGIFIYAPGIVSIFPGIPGWVGRLFPTYYVINPVMEIAREGGSWSTVYIDVLILIGIIALFIVIVGVIAAKTRQQEV